MTPSPVNLHKLRMAVMVERRRAAKVVESFIEGAPEEDRRRLEAMAQEIRRPSAIPRGRRRRRACGLCGGDDHTSLTHPSP